MTAPLASPPSSRTAASADWRHRYAGLALFALGALPLVAPSGYSVGAALLLLGGLTLLRRRPAPPPTLDRHDRWLVVALLGYASVMLVSALWHGDGLAAWDKPLRFWLALPALGLLLVYPPRLAWLWSGLALGALGGGGLALWQRLVEGAPRASGLTQVIQFGNTGLLLGMFCLAGLGWAWAQPHRRRWVALLAAGAAGGLLASLLSGSRGGWVGLPLILVVLYRAYGGGLSWRLKGAVAAALLCLGLGIYHWPATGVQARVHQAFSDVALYVSGERVTTSVGFRFEMWQGALRLAAEKPLLGWGVADYQAGMTALAEAGHIHPTTANFGHAHNQFLDTLAKQGLVGLAALLLLYLLPLRLFSPHLRAPCLEARALATGGALLSVAYIDFSLSQGFLAHNSGVMIYAFWLVTWWGLLHGYRRDHAPAGGHA